MLRIDRRIQKDLEKITKTLKNKFKNNLVAFILYGSWLKGKARIDSDIDLLIIFRNKKKSLSWKHYELIDELDLKRHVSLVSTSIKEFKQETVPLYTAAKKEGQIIYGIVDLTLNPESPHIKYRDFFKRSEECEKGKVKTANYLMKKGVSSGICEFCYIASKHAIQAGLAMKGAGFSSKFCILFRWTEKYFGKELAKTFKIIFALYVKSEYKMQGLNKRENLLCIKKARRILNKIY